MDDHLTRDSDGLLYYSPDGIGRIYVQDVDTGEYITDLAEALQYLGWNLWKSTISSSTCTEPLTEF